MDLPEGPVPGRAPDAGLARRITALSQRIGTSADLVGAVRAVVDTCALAVPAASSVSVTLLQDGRPYTLATSGLQASRLDELQYAHGLGPCLESLETGLPTDVPDTASDGRWGGYPRLAAAAGVGAVFAHPLPTPRTVRGALNVYGAAPGCFDGPDRERVSVLAHQAGVSITLLIEGIDLRERTEQLQQALTSRAVIDMAKGVLVAEHGIGPDAAFDLLSRQSQRSNRRLRDIAAELVDRRTRERPPG